MRTVLVLMRDRYGECYEFRLSIPAGQHIDESNISIALDYLGWGNPEPWTLVSWEVQS